MEVTAQLLANSRSRYYMKRFPNNKQLLESYAQDYTTNTGLQGYIKNGVGMHHSAMPKDDKESAEKLFAKIFLKILVCTTTGVNLPTHLVIIKQTQLYSTAKATDMDYTETQMKQMIGRAGRPQVIEM